MASDKRNGGGGKAGGMRRGERGEGGGGGGGGGGGAGRGGADLTTGFTRRVDDRPQSPSRGQSPPGFTALSPHSSPLPETSTSNRPLEDVERLRRVVRATMSLHDTRGGRGGGGGGGERRVSRGGDSHAPQWSQNHEACMSDMRRRLQEAGSPLVRAKDPAVLIGALLRRQVC